MLNEFLMSVGFISLKSDMCVFKRDVAGMDVLRYVKATSNLALIFRGFDRFFLESYGDSDWAVDLQSGKSVYGYFIFLSGCLISWKSKKSTTVATSTTIAEIECLSPVCAAFMDFALVF